MFAALVSAACIHAETAPHVVSLPPFFFFWLFLFAVFLGRYIYFQQEEKGGDYLESQLYGSSAKFHLA